MNERIRELALQAENYAAEQNDKFGVSYKKTYNEKFAELIVRECITVINQPNGVGDDDVIRISRDVEKHFGVEE